MVNGLDITNMQDFDYVCEGCALGKSHHLPFPETSHTKHEKMDLIAVDLSGPMSVSTWTGMRYAFVAIDVGTRYSIRCLLESKDEAATILKEVIAIME